MPGRHLPGPPSGWALETARFGNGFTATGRVDHVRVDDLAAYLRRA
jgi:hypothetical protein